MSDSEVYAVILAWLKPGPRPDIHAEAKRRLHKEWPTLAEAVQRLVDTHTHQGH